MSKLLDRILHRREELGRPGSGVQAKSESGEASARDASVKPTRPGPDQARGEVGAARLRSLVDELGSRLHSLSEPAAAKELVDLSEAAVPFLIENLTESSYIPLILGQIGDARATEPLMALARTPSRFATDPDAYSGYACEMAVSGLGLLGDQRALPLLRETEATTNVGEIAMAARAGIDRLGAAAGRPPELEGLGLNDDELEGLARSQSTPPETLDALAGC
jgi:hypothetical protein